MRGHQSLRQAPTQEGDIAGKDQDVPVESLEGGLGLKDGMGRAALLCLQNEFDWNFAQGLPNPVGLISDHDQSALHAEAAA
jgi:hypothetical protein